LKTINAHDEVWPITFGNALAPFIIKRADPRRLAFIGDFIPEPYDVLSDGGTVDGLAEAIVKTGLAINLKRIPADAAIIGTLQRAYRGRGFVMIKPWRKGCPYIELGMASFTRLDSFFGHPDGQGRRSRRLAVNENVRPHLVLNRSNQRLALE
jgi:hypothetical protein